MLSSRRSRPAARALLALAGALAGTAAAPAQELRGPVTKTIVFEKRHQFFVRGYEEPVVFDPGAAVSRPPSTASADEMAIYVLSLRAAGEVEAWLALRDAAGAEAFRRRLEAEGSSVGQLAARWRRDWKGRRVELTRHVDHGRDVIIRFVVLDAATRQPERRDALLLRHGEDGRWQLGELAGDVVAELGEFDGAERIVERPWKSGGSTP